MPEFNTGNPLGSMDPRDLFDNAGVLDQIVNAADKTIQDRTGNSVRSVKGLMGDIERNYDTFISDNIQIIKGVPVDAAAAQKAADEARQAAEAARLSSGVYATTTAGLAGTASGTYFSVPSDNTNEYLILYRNNAGTATEVKRYPSSQSVVDLQSRVQEYNARRGRVPLVVDESGQVPLWLEDGKLEALGLGSTITSQLGLKQYDASAGRVPLVVDESGKVAVWLENGKLEATGLGASLLSSLQGLYALPVAPLSAKAPISTDGRSMYSWRAKRSKIKRGTAAKTRIAITGDSWTEFTPIPQQLANRLYPDMGKSGEGWISVNNHTEGPHMLNGVTFTKSGWTNYDASAGAAPAYGPGLDGQYSSSADTAATLSIGNCSCTNFTIYYRNHGGRFRYRVDGGAWVEVVSDTSATLGKVSLSGLAASAHTFDIDTTTNTGTVVINGFRAWTENATGVEVVKCGNAGLTGTQLRLFTDYIAPIAADFPPDVVLVILGTNDYRVTYSSVNGFIAGIGLLVTAFRQASPNCSFIFVTPADSNGVAVQPLTQYRDALYKYCVTNGHEYYNMLDDWSSFAVMNALGQWANSLHVNDDGAAALADRLCSLLLLK